MSLQPPELDSSASEDKGVFFMEYDWKEEDQMDHHKLILRKADALASENCLKEAIDWFAMAMRHGAVRPEELSVLVDCILRNFTLNAAEPDASHSELGPDKDMFDCPGCHGFLGEPITLACGHSYCTRCLRRAKLSRCKTCREPLRGGELKVNVVLGGLLNACFVEELKRYKAVGEVEELTRRKCYQEAVSLASELINSDVEASPAARLARAEAYTALRQYRLALEDVVFCLDSGRSAEGVFRKATVLQAMGQVDESLQVFLQCLALDEDFTVARRQVEMILCELLSPAGDSLKEGLRETTQGASPRLRSKTPVFGAPAQNAPEQRCQVQSRQQQQQQQQQSRAASVHTWAHIQKTGWSDRLQRSGLSRAHSLCIHTSVSAEEGLKRVCSAPQLGCQDRGGLLKRKLSVSESKRWVRCVGGSKHPKQGELWGAKHRAAAAKASRDVPRLNPNDLECALCMRLFYEPVTTPCGHTFCKNCLERCLDHTPQCPLCKESLKEYLASRKYVVTALLDELIRQQLRVEHAERAKAHLEETQELSDLTKGVPIFVCTMAYPTVPCPLHVFEPRYRLMIRRCMGTGTQQFGMCINDPVKGFVDYGCMLIIRSVHFLPDGRSVVDTVGGKRFRVLSRGMKDGYSVADIEHLEDSRVEDGEELSSLQELHDAVYEQACTWFKTLKVRFHNQIMQHFGPMPEREADIQATPNGPACCWWLLAVLPVDPRYQLSVLSMTSLRQRLLKIQHILTYLQSIPGS